MNGIINLPGDAPIDLTSLPVLIFYGQKSGSTYAIPSSNVVKSCNPEYFEYDSSTREFTCKKSFTGNVYILSTSNMNSAGSGNVITYCRWRLYIDGSRYADTGSGNSVGRYNTYENVPFTANGITYIQGYCYGNSKSGYGDFLYIVKL